MNRREFRTLTLPALLAGALLSTGCFTPEGYGADVAVEGHGEAGDTNHAAAEHTAEVDGHGGETVPAGPEGIQPGTKGKRLEIKVPEIEYEGPFSGTPSKTETIANNITVETFAEGEGEPIADWSLVEFSYTGYGTATGQKVMGSRAGPSKLMVNASEISDPIAQGLVDAMRGRKPGSKIRIKVPATAFGDDAPPQVLALGDLILTVEILGSEQKTPLSGIEAYAGEPVATQKLDNGLEIYDYRAGEGPEAADGDTVITHYIGQLADGTEFDSSHGRPEGLSGIANGPGLIKGFSQGLAGTRAGMLRKLVIPPEIGYGAADRGKIPPNSTLVFFLEIQEIRDGAAQGVQIGADGTIKDTSKPKTNKPKDGDQG